MALPLVSFQQAKEHLKLADDTEQADVERKINTATALVLKHIGREDNPQDWSIDTDPVQDLDYALVQGCVLELVGDMYRNRGDDPDAEQRVQEHESGAFLKPVLRRKLHYLRTPSLA